MGTNISSGNDYLNKPCERCGGKKRTSRKWKETIPTLMGTTVVEYSQIVCRNKECQAVLDKQLLDEKKKREVVRIKKEEDQALRKANSLTQAIKTRKNKSRI